MRCTCDLVDVVREGQRDDVGFEAVDHAARLLAGTAMGLANGDRFAGLRFPVAGERRVHVPVQLTRGVVRDVQQRDVGLRGECGRQQRQRQESLQHMRITH